MPTPFKPGFTSLDYFIDNSFLGRAAPNDEKGFLKLSRFGVLFVLPGDVNFSTQTNVSKDVVEEFMENNVKSIDIPSVTLSESRVVTRTHIGDRNPTDITITFFESPGLSIHNSVMNWMNEIIEFKSDIDNFRRKYLDEVTARVEVFPLMGDDSRGQRKQVFSDVFPVSINPIQLNIEADNEVGTVAIRFRYRFHTVEEV
jgi:hypothetical protein